MSEQINWELIEGGITAPSGLKASGIEAGLKNSGKLDLALLQLPAKSNCAGVFTQSTTRASCVDLCIERLKANSGNVNAVLINSGQANAFTGPEGHLDSLKVTNDLAKKLGVDKSKVLICSTGVIGQRFSEEKIINSLDALIRKLSTNGSEMAAKAILTTDLQRKEVAFEAMLGDKKVRIGGIAKGSGMIHPNMATMLAFVSCDVKLPSKVLSRILEKTVNLSFNAITVDGDTSTNDAFLLFSNGEHIDPSFYDVIEEGIIKVSQHLAKLIGVDGEGANCIFEVKIIRGPSFDEAMKIARLICSSNLVKAAIHGCDPNWGRVIAAIGSSMALINEEKISLFFGNYEIVNNGKILNFDKESISQYLKSRRNNYVSLYDPIQINIDLGIGEYEAVAWGCDLSKEYVAINSEYTT